MGSGTFAGGSGQALREEDFLTKGRLGSWVLDTESLHVAAPLMEPVEFHNEFGGQLDALGVDLVAPIVDLALPANDVEITTGYLGKENGALLVFELLETTDAAAVAKPFPMVLVACHLFH